ncbi:MAG TPA: HypC/HybG/HupF family hydrogenase formation chaperone [Polyangiaceae bacterium]|nr:HypC/HybG/HupF family hydrogenase formation chaperone [Polyangiaceae bacterium]
MCLGVPGRLVELYVDGDLRMGKVVFGGVAKAVCLEHVPEARVGDYVLVHVGFALARIDEAEARRVFDLLETLGKLDDVGVP